MFRKGKLVLAGLLLAAAAAVGLLGKTAVYADNCYDEGLCNGPHIFQTRAIPGALEVDWSYFDQPYRVVVYRGDGSDRDVHPEAYTVVLSENVTVQGGSLYPNQFIDSGLPTGAAFRYYVCGEFSVRTDDGGTTTLEDCSDSPAGPVPSQSNGGSAGSGGGGGSGSHGGGGSNSGTPPPPAPPPLTAPTNVQLTGRTHTSLSFSWTPGTYGDSILLICHDAPNAHPCGDPLGSVPQTGVRNIELAPDATSYTITGLRPGHQYDVEVCEFEHYARPGEPSSSGSEYPCAAWITVHTTTLPTDLRLLSRDSTGITLAWSDLDGGPVVRYLVYRNGFPVSDRSAATGFIPVGSLTPQFAPGALGSAAYYGNLVYPDQFTTSPLWTYVYRICPIVDGMNAAEKAALPNLPDGCSADFSVDGLPGGPGVLGAHPPRLVP